MTAVPDAAVEAFRAAEAQAWKAAAPIETQGRAVEVNRDATRAGLEAAAPLLTAHALAEVDRLRGVLGHLAEVADRHAEDHPFARQALQDLAAFARRGR